jgi:hypothetical protein
LEHPGVVDRVRGPAAEHHDVVTRESHVPCVAAGVHAGKCEKAFYAVDNVLTPKAAIDEAEERGIRGRASTRNNYSSTVTGHISYYVSPVRAMQIYTPL